MVGTISCADPTARFPCMNIMNQSPLQICASFELTYVFRARVHQACYRRHYASRKYAPRYTAYHLLLKRYNNDYVSPFGQLALG
jgi:hypothetical protein